MNATELAKMLEGWPEEARPDIGPICSGGGKDWITAPAFCKQETIVGLGVSYAIDLACMSGLRWLMKQKPGGKSSEPDETYRVIVDENWRLSETERHVVSLAYSHDDYYVHELEDSYYGPTLLHAIDAAIKATKGNQ